MQHRASPELCLRSQARVGVCICIVHLPAALTDLAGVPLNMAERAAAREAKVAIEGPDEALPPRIMDEPTAPAAPPIAAAATLEAPPARTQCQQTIHAQPNLTLTILDKTSRADHAAWHKPNHMLSSRVP